MGTRNIKRVVVSQPLLAELLTTGNVVEKLYTVEGVPPGAEFVGGYFDAASTDSYFVFKHPTFDEVPPGVAVPTIEVKFRREFPKIAEISAEPDLRTYDDVKPSDPDDDEPERI